MNCDYHKHLEIWIKFKDFKGLEMSIWYLNSVPFVLVILHHCPYAITMGYHGTEMKYVNTKYCAEQAKVCIRKSHISKKINNPLEMRTENLNPAKCWVAQKWNRPLRSTVIQNEPHVSFHGLKSCILGIKLKIFT